MVEIQDRDTVLLLLVHPQEDALLPARSNLLYSSTN